MKFKCERDALSDALQTVQRAVSARPGIPALTGVLMNASGSQLVLATTDLEVSAQLRLEGVQVHEEGVALVPARLLADMVKSFEQAPVEFEAQDNQATIVCSNYRGTVRCLPAEDFPILQEPSGTRVQVAGPEFALGVSQVARAASRDEARPILTGVLLEVTPEGLTMVATDSYRLSLRELTASAQGEAKALVPERALAEAGRAAQNEQKEVELFVDASSVSFHIGALTLSSRLIEGEFPNYRQLLPEGYENRLSGSRTQLLDAVRRVGLLARESSPVKMEFNALGVRLSSQSPDLGQAVEVVEAQYEGADLVAAFNPTYLSEGLTAAAGDRVMLEVRDGLKPALIKGEGEEFVYLVMPVRLPAHVG